MKVIELRNKLNELINKDPSIAEDTVYYLNMNNSIKKIILDWRYDKNKNEIYRFISLQ